MITFLPYPDFAKSAACLDAQRLGKQRVEALQILHVLLRKRCEGLDVVPFTGKGHAAHPATTMWRGHEPALARYTRCVCRHWIHAFGFRDTVDGQVALLVPGVVWDSDVPMPPWIGDPAFHASHRGNLVRKDPRFYAGMLRWTDSPTLACVWPVR